MKHLLLLLLLITGITAFSQQKAGSAYTLNGVIFSFNCFVSTPGDEWTEEGKSEMIRKLSEAESWISAQAMPFNVRLKFHNVSQGFEKDIKLPYVERGTSSGNEDVKGVSVILNKIGYPNPPDWYRLIKKKYQPDNVQVLIFIKGQGNCYAMAMQSGMDSTLYFVEGAMIYEKYWNNYNLASSSIAHEMLHLYGAWDLYKTFEQTKEREDKAKEIFPNSIMLRTSFNISDLNIDELSAWLIGWNQEEKGWYEWFRPSGRMDN